MKRAVVFCFAFVATPAVALAQALPSVPGMSCAQARRLVQSSGAIVLSTGRYTYDRYVANGGFCQIDQYASPAFEPTRDDPTCMIGYYCKGRNDYR